MKKRNVACLAGAVVLAATLTISGSAIAQDGADAHLAETIDAILTDARLDGSQIGVVVADATTGDVLYDHNGHTRGIPASNTKLLTSAAAMHHLGPDHRFVTDVATSAKQYGSALLGDLYLRGTGDPTTLAADYDALAAAVAASGVKTVTGGLVADDTAFDAQRNGSDWAADDESAYYAAQISALTVAPDTDYDAGTVIVTATPGAKPGDAPVYTIEPDNGYVTIVNKGKTVPSGQTDTLGISREHGSNRIVISGQIPVGASATKDWISVWEPTGYAADVFRRALKSHGVRVLGATKLGSATPEGARRLAAHESMTLSELLIPFMKLSNNMHAEALTKAVGRAVSGAGTWSAGIAAIRAYVATRGMKVSALRQADGSGLSRRNDIPAQEIAKLLVGVRDEPWFADWYTSLPVACNADRLVGGTLRTRMCASPAAKNNVHAKTGSLTGVSGLSGYVTDADGRALVFSVVTNDYLASSVKDIEDKIAIALANHTASAPAAKAATDTLVPEDTVSRDVECTWVKPDVC
ncbi:D-alanyl-D-alanine carboxypeptidase/D-alanyl-D-alanine endopeptidase [Phytomonospora endophytica]|uniref:D-alanyl-D-alanine carboxypeptidase/D-alanyl-D-alanine-endopeptidase (Penicillin-binding protein 4) n=1 Tax=Phytomonospora endophytica TaxID=714109 RepID=A0A841FM36_9ACTN|nr:D-alanyl-D-alanine carboxypeptidase/D-alanyl-D-alanine-endopeptidase [Phytomonospora endophytica]MBB6036924.1 D-alanyl-D-alanine carboxypeptidase/D-alanyl-D-alanine-endopeptidase (penicillin-binding protein 4) [Phytomonospora endophytica]GIG68045.1 D-alanyl-D-alanine carboxypeptidase DacC [Phytomonospora endophytica]